MTEREKKLLGVLGAVIALVVVALGAQAYAAFRASIVASIDSLSKDIAKMSALEATLPAERAHLAELERQAGAGTTGDAPKDIYEAARILARSLGRLGLESERSAVSGNGDHAIVDVAFKGKVPAMLTILRECSSMRNVIVLSARIDVDAKGLGAEGRLRMGYAAKK